MRFAPQRRAMFPHPNFKKWSEPGVFCTFWLANVLLATVGCNFSFLFWTATSAPAALANLLFDPPETQIIGKTQHFATFRTFRAIVSSFYWPYFLLTLLLCFAFHFSILSEVRLLNFLWLSTCRITWISMEICFPRTSMLAQLQICSTLPKGPSLTYWMTWLMVLPCLFEAEGSCNMCTIHISQQAKQK